VGTPVRSARPSAASRLAQRAVHPAVVGVQQSNAELLFPFGAVEGRGRVELGQRCLVGALDLAVEVGHARHDQPMLDAHRGQLVADLVGHEFGTFVGLRALNRERDLIEVLLEELERVSGRVAGVDGRTEVARAIIDEGVLVEARGELQRVPLQALAGQRGAVAQRRLRVFGLAAVGAAPHVI
jgi:hypothetical protein